MIINPKLIVSSGAMYSPDLPFNDDKQVQPNGIDIRVSKVERVGVNFGKPLKMWADGRKKVVDTQPCEGTLLPDKTEAVVIERGYAYSITCHEVILVPENTVAFIYGRSTLHRNGIFCRASVYDSGFHDYCGFMMFPFCNFHLEMNTRVAQVLFMEAKSAHNYSGQYGINGGEIIEKVY